jgi:hypothetical protein
MRSIKTALVSGILAIAGCAAETTPHPTPTPTPQTSSTAQLPVPAPEEPALGDVAEPSPPGPPPGADGTGQSADAGHQKKLSS